MRYAFAALFSEGLLMPAGYEYGAKTRIDVVHGTPKDVDKQQWDMTTWIKHTNDYKRSTPVLGEEGTWKALVPYESEIIVLEKSSNFGAKPVLVLYNKNKEKSLIVTVTDLPKEVLEYTKIIRIVDDVRNCKGVGDTIDLAPQEMVVLSGN
jgi:starch synthase (maltosyl-transferring)